MEFDREKEAEKRSELLAQIQLALEQCGIPKNYSASSADNIMDACISTRPPEEPERFMHLITMSSMGSGGAKSTKPGNVRLNIGDLIEAIASGVLTGVGAVQVPWTAPFAALVVWRSLRRAAQVEISETEAAVLYTMWAHKDGNREVPDAGLLEKCNSLLKKYGRPELSKELLSKSLNSLENIASIQRSPKRADMWWLREWVSVTYS